MDKFKQSNYGIILFISILIFLVGIGSLIFFNNSSNLQVSLQTNDEQLQKVTLLNDVLTHTVMSQRDSLNLKDSVIQNRDSIILSLKKQIKEFEKNDTIRVHL